MNRRSCAFVLWFAALCLCAAGIAAPLERDLGHGLRLYRVRALPADLPPASESGGKAAACVVDVRYVFAEADAAAAFGAWLRFRAKPRAPVFVLANAQTSNALLRVLAERERGGGAVLIGVGGRQLEPDSPVRTTAQDERRAYDALEKEGVAVEKLLTENADKVRNDEASLSRDRLAEASADAAAEALDPQSRPPIDVALQRAVHLHRALLALKKL
jgi:hypothetical protein